MAKAKKPVKKTPAPKKVAKKAVKPAAKKAVKPVKKAAKPAPKKAVKKAVVKAKPVKKAVKKVVPKAKTVSKAKAKAPAKKVAAKKAAKSVAKKPVPVKPVKKAAGPKKTAAPKKAVKPAAKVAPKKAAPPKAAPQKSKPVAKTPAKPAAKPAAKAVVAKNNKVTPAPVSKKDAGKAKKGKKDDDGVELEEIPGLEEFQAKPKKQDKTPKKKEPKIIKEMPARALITMEKKEEPKETLHYEYPTLRYSDEELKEFKDIIDKKLVTAREELKNLKESLDSHTDSQAGNKSWNMEEGQDTSEMEYLMNQISRQNKFIRDLEMALVRIENKTYGICRATGKLIDKNRLRIVPHATLSIEAKMSRKTDDVAAPNASGNAAHMGSEGEGFGGDD
ncbi:MAG: TraR/DksA family transcriptional regulator [Chitinophagales bacterium]